MLKAFCYNKRFVKSVFFRKRPILHHTCVTNSELPSYISTMSVRTSDKWYKYIIKIYIFYCMDKKINRHLLTERYFFLVTVSFYINFMPFFMFDFSYTEFILRKHWSNVSVSFLNVGISSKKRMLGLTVHYSLWSELFVYRTSLWMFQLHVPYAV